MYEYKYKQIEQKLESMFMKKKSLKPIVAARTVAYYFKMPDSMLPLLVKIAQKTKDRLRKREKRQIEKRSP